MTAGTSVTSRNPDRYDVAIALSYYAPYVSGLTTTAQVVAEGLAAQGRRVVVVTSRHDPALPPRETVNGVDVIRTPVVARVGKGTVSPTFVPTAGRVARRSRVLHLHLPMLEAGAIAMAAGRTPVVSTYHCDVALPPGAFNRLQVQVLDASHRLALRRSSVAVVSSQDYAQSSRLWGSIRRRFHAVPPPCLLREGGSPTFRRGAGLHVGFLGRIVEEKGLEYLVDGFRALDASDARLLVGGDFSAIAGGSVVDKVLRHIDGDPRVTMLGFVADDQLPDFFASLDAFALPSVNSLEAFGIVQAEAMMAGVPVIASDRPGVRTLVQSTGFGTLVAPRDAAGITRALEDWRVTDEERREGMRAARSRYAREAVISQYAEILDRHAR